MGGTENILVIALVGVGSLGLVAVMLYLFYRRSNPKRVQQRGRDNQVANVVAAARRFAKENSFRFISPAVLHSGDKVADLDALVIGGFGVLGIKGLGYNGEIYGTAAEKEWLQVTSDKERTHFPNPIIEAAADVRVLRDNLFAARLKQVPVEVVCVFADSGAKLALPRGTGHYSLKEFKELLKKEKYLEEKGLDPDAIEAALRSALGTTG